MSCHSVAVVLTLVQTKQTRINIHKNKKTQYKLKNPAQTQKNTVQTQKKKILHKGEKHSTNCKSPLKSDNNTYFIGSSMGIYNNIWLSFS